MILYARITSLVTVELASSGVGITKKLEELWMKILPWPMGTVMLALIGTKVCTNCGYSLEFFGFTIVSHHSFSHYYILPTEVCKIMKHIVFCYLNLRLTQSFCCDGFIYNKSKLWYIHFHPHDERWTRVTRD